jgi:hypothetical protein
VAFADVYDRWYDQVSDAEATARFVAARCPSGTVVELGVGSGRLARPMLALDLMVIGVDASPAMLSRCPGGVIKVMADMSELPLAPGPAGRPGPTVLCAFNTLFNVPSPQGQQRLWSTLGSVGATVIVETINLDLLSDTTFSIGVSDVSSAGVVVSSTSSDGKQQILVGRHLDITDDGIVSRPWALRWTPLDEMDSMARSAGLQLIERYGSWTQQPFGRDAATAISVYRPSPTARTAASSPGETALGPDRRQRPKSARF